ncbi:hypothetical protein ACJZ2D_003394 [Fusarium nematophilum]
MFGSYFKFLLIGKYQDWFARQLLRSKQPEQLLSRLGHPLPISSINDEDDGVHAEGEALPGCSMLFSSGVITHVVGLVPYLKVVAVDCWACGQRPSGSIVTLRTY